MIIVTGTLHARADSLAEVLALSRAHVLRSRAEPGCLEHGVAISDEDPMQLVFFERWADMASLGVHLKLPASRGFGKGVAGLVDQAPTLNMYEANPLAMP
ncbi:MAG: putative quinol monooxygenase [Burkholderiales bacterium]